VLHYWYLEDASLLRCEGVSLGESYQCFESSHCLCLQGIRELGLQAPSYHSMQHKTSGLSRTQLQQGRRLRSSSVPPSRGYTLLRCLQASGARNETRLAVFATAEAPSGFSNKHKKKFGTGTWFGKVATVWHSDAQAADRWAAENVSAACHLSF
jgi:hypothetical protein